jgi:Spy/CpxP family protein refolding chaperone
MLSLVPVYWSLETGPMRRIVAVVLLLSVALVLGAGAQDKEKDKKDKDKPKEPDKKLKGTLPQYFKALGLTDAQKQRVYKIRAETKEKLDELEKTKAKLKAEEKEALEKVLTPDQLKELKKLRSGEKDKDK